MWVVCLCIHGCGTCRFQLCVIELTLCYFSADGHFCSSLQNIRTVTQRYRHYCLIECKSFIWWISKLKNSQNVFIIVSKNDKWTMWYSTTRLFMTAWTCCLVPHHAATYFEVPVTTPEYQLTLPPFHCFLNLHLYHTISSQELQPGFLIISQTASLLSQFCWYRLAHSSAYTSTNRLCGF